MRRIALAVFFILNISTDICATIETPPEDLRSLSHVSRNQTHVSYYNPYLVETFCIPRQGCWIQHEDKYIYRAEVYKESTILDIIEQAKKDFPKSG